MAYFRCSAGADAGGGATITVTYNSSFYNKTMTCSNGTKTYTKTTTSSGSTEFKVSDEGTWTITCNGVSRTVLVTLNYTTQMAVTKTVTVYSAANDTVSFTDAVGSKTVTTNSSGQGSVSITFIPPSQSITFTSSVAKNPSNLSAAYSKNINLTESISSIKVMPNGALYWYGFITSDLEANGITRGTWSKIAPTYSTNYIQTSTNTNYSFSMLNTKNAMTGTFKWIGKVVSNDYWYSNEDSKSFTTNLKGRVTSTSLETHSTTLTNQYGVVGNDRGGTYSGACTAQFNAIWVE